MQVAVYRGVESELTWHGIVTNDKLGEPSDIQVVVVNEAGHLSTPRTIQEALSELRGGGGGGGGGGGVKEGEGERRRYEGRERGCLFSYM